MSPACARALELFEDAEGPSPFVKRAYDYFGRAGWNRPNRASYGVPGGMGAPDEFSGAPGSPGGSSAGVAPAGVSTEQPWYQGFVPQGAQGWADTVRGFTPGGTAGLLAASPLAAGATGLAGGTVSALRGKGFGAGFKNWSGLGAAKEIWDTVKAPVQAAKGLVSGAMPAATGLGKALPGVGAAIGMAQSGYGAVTGDQNYMSDGFFGQMGEQTARTVGNLMSGAKLGPYGMMAVGGAELANVGSNVARAGGAVWDAVREGGFGSKGKVENSEIEAFKQRKAQRKADALGSTAGTSGALK